MFEAAIFLCWACFLIKFIPLKLWKAQMGGLESTTDQVSIKPETNRQDNPPDLRLAKAKSIKRTVYRVALHAPKAFVCLPQALTARWMLKRRQVKTDLFIGARHSQSGIDLHAWLKCGDFYVTGEKEFGSYVPFKSPQNKYSDSLSQTD